MPPHDDTHAFIPVGRMGIGRATVVGGGRAAATMQLTIPTRDAHGCVTMLCGAGADLASAVAAAFAPLSVMPFAIDAAVVEEGHAAEGGVAARVLVRAVDAAAPRHTVGHATAADAATAVAVATARSLATGGFLRRSLLPSGSPDVAATTERIVAGLSGLLPGGPLPPETLGAVRELVAHELHRFGEGQAIVAAHAPDRTALLTRFDAPATLEQPGGEPRDCDTHTTSWWEWYPGLDNDARTLRDVLAELPAAPPAAIPWIVRLFENDKGWLRLHGAVSLRHHDMIHVLLGRGLLDQDEAFVIGFTMGSTKSVSRLERWFFRCAVSRLYPEPYRIHSLMLAAYDLGLEAGREFGARDLHRRLRDDMLDRPLGDVRRELEIDTRRLRRFYARERAAVPGTLASLRLPVGD